MILIADSGSTKTTWACIEPNAGTNTALHPITSLGINPIRDNEETIVKAIERARENLYQQAQIVSEAPFSPDHIKAVHFYGSGCIPPYSTTVKRILQRAYPRAEVSVESDMLGATLALCGHHEGIACILGTGSNSCLFDGQQITQQTPALGFILGDEGSGASLGKHLVADILKRQLPVPLQEAFTQETGLTQAEIINRVYRQPQPNRFLASLTPFLERHRHEPSIHQLLVDEFRRFLSRNIRNYQRPDLPVNFVGGITASFRPELEEAIMAEGMQLGRILSQPIGGMADYFRLKIEN